MKKLVKKCISLVAVIVLLCVSTVTYFATETPSTLLGDANKDNIVGIPDATIIQQFKASLIDESKLSINNADVNQDGEVSIVDATGIQLYQAKLIKDFSEYKVNLPEKNIENTESVKVTEYTKDGIKYKKEVDSSGKTTTYKWIVDKLAQTILDPIYETKILCICNICGADVSGDENGKVGDFDPEYANMYFAQYHWHVQHCSSAWHSEGIATLVGYNETFIPEQGHWELINK